ncbi:MAG: glycosyltransferase family 2 protein [Deltaproteobacteria bacterium]
MTARIPKVTVFMPVYNGEKYIRHAIDSVLRQSFMDFELLIINDGSTDDSVEIIRSYRDHRIRILHNESNSGLVQTRNRGIREASAEYIALLDSDDIAFPNRLEEQLSFMEGHPGYGFVGSWVELIDENGESAGDVIKYILPPDYISSAMLFSNYFAQSAIFLKKSALPNEAYRSDFPLAEDYDLWVRMSDKVKCWNLQKTLTRYRVHSEGISQQRATVLEENVRKIQLDQLRCLGIDATNDELALHRRVGCFDFKGNPPLLEEVMSWLNRIYTANRDSNRYPASVLGLVLGTRWLSACCGGPGRILWPGSIFWRSYFSRYAAMSIAKRAAWFFQRVTL